MNLVEQIALKRPYRSAALSCSFCGKDSDEVNYLVAGPNALICNECVELCREIGAKMVIDRAVRGASKAE